MSNMYRNRDGLVVNMFDCTACPKCKSPFRYPFPQENPDCRCDDCGYVEPWSAINGKPAAPAAPKAPEPPPHDGEGGDIGATMLAKALSQPREPTPSPDGAPLKFQSPFGKEDNGNEEYIRPHAAPVNRLCAEIENGGPEDCRQMCPAESDLWCPSCKRLPRASPAAPRAHSIHPRCGKPCRAADTGRPSDCTCGCSSPPPHDGEGAP